MNSSSFCLFVIVLVIDEISHGHGHRRDEQEVKNKLLELLRPSETPKVVEDPSIEPRESNLINSLQYFLDYKSPQDISINFKGPPNNNGRNDIVDEDDSRAANNPKDLFGESTIFKTRSNDNFEAFSRNDKPHQYEVREEREEPSDFQFFDYNHDNSHVHLGYEQNHGFYQGSGFHYHHHHHGHYDEHNPGCFPHRRRPPPSRPRPTTTAPSDIVDPRASTVAGFMTTQVPRIDIRGLI